MTTGFHLNRLGDLFYDPSAHGRHKKIITYADAIFGGYCLLMAAVALWAWWQGQTGLRSFFAFILFIAINAAISQLAARMTKPHWAEVGRLLAGTIAAPLLYLLIQSPFPRWWPA